MNPFINGLILLTTLFFLHSSFSQVPTSGDTAINQSVKNRFASDKTLAGTNIEISTSKGVVLLSGHVNSADQAVKATEIAQSMPQVNDVITDKLIIKTNHQPLSDAFITAKINGLIVQQKIFSDSEASQRVIHVETNNGIVSLSGTVDNQNQADLTVEIAKSIPGVKNVKSSIQIIVRK